MKVCVSLTVEVDPEAWKASENYGGDTPARDLRNFLRSELIALPAVIEVGGTVNVN